MRTHLRTGLAFLVLAAAACGSEDPDTGGPDETPDANVTPGGPDAATPAAGRYLPMKVGQTWTYRMTNPSTGEVGERITRVEAYEAVGDSHPGKMAYRLRVEKLVGFSIYWQGLEGEATVRYRSDDYGADGALLRRQIHTPYRLKLDESPAKIAAGASYTDTFEQTTTDAAGSKVSTETDAWSVVSAAESVTVPSGTYPDALHIRRIGNEAGTKMKDYWYVRGIGKVKETGSDKQTEELVGTTSP